MQAGPGWREHKCLILSCLGENQTLVHVGVTVLRAQADRYRGWRATGRGRGGEEGRVGKAMPGCEGSRGKRATIWSASALGRQRVGAGRLLAAVPLGSRLPARRTLAAWG